MRLLPSVPVGLIASAVLLTAGGCLVSSSNSTYETGRSISDTTKAQIELGQTTGDWLLATLGEPSSRHAVGDDSSIEVWRYDHVKRTESDGAVFLLFSGSSSKSTTTTTFFELTDGIVTRYWSE